MIETVITIFVILGVVGLVGTVYAYAQPSASNWCVVYLIMLVIGGVGFIVTIILKTIFKVGG